MGFKDKNIEDVFNWQKTVFISEPIAVDIFEQFVHQTRESADQKSIWLAFDTTSPEWQTYWTVIDQAVQITLSAARIIDPIQFEHMMAQYFSVLPSSPFLRALSHYTVHYFEEYIHACQADISSPLLIKNMKKLKMRYEKENY